LCPRRILDDRDGRARERLPGLLWHTVDQRIVAVGEPVVILILGGSAKETLSHWFHGRPSDRLGRQHVAHDRPGDTEVLR